MRIPSELRKLGRLFPQETPLYLVGGAVRDNLLGIQSSDFDVACALTTSQVKTLLVGSSYSIRGEYPRTGTLVIVGSRIIVEYTTFRTDSYPIGKGDHAPQDVTFTTDIYLDARRRDFSCNAIYYDIAKDSFIDPTDGITAIQNRLIDTVREPDEVLQEDALRIMRIARLSCELGFHATPEVVASASRHVSGLKDIARERIGAEVLKILNCKSKYSDYHGYFKPSYGLVLLGEIGANELIFGRNIPLTTLFSLDNMKDSGHYEYNATMQLALILLDFNAKEAEKVMYNLALSNADIAEINKLMSGYISIENADLDGMTYDSAKLTVAKVYDRAREITAIRLAKGQSITRLCDIAHVIGNLQLPTKVSDLKINGNDVIDKGYVGTEIGKVIEYTQIESIRQELTTRQQQLMLIDLYAKGRQDEM